MSILRHYINVHLMVLPIRIFLQNLPFILGKFYSHKIEFKS